MLIYGVVVLLVAGGIGWYVLTQQGNNAATTATPMEPTSTAIQPTVGTGNINTTMPDLVARGQNLECDWKLPVQQPGFSDGKLWTTGNKGRSTIAGTVSDMSMEANAIYADGTVFSWVDLAGQKKGFKITPEEAKQMNNTMSPEEKQQAEQIRQQMVFHCQPWTPDPTKFTLPTDVVFE